MLWAILGCVLNVLAVLALAPLLQGIMRRLTARIQSRQGPPLLQPYFDLLKLLGKEDLESGESPAMQRFAVWLALAAELSVACLLPLGFAAPMKGMGDILLLIYLLTLCGVSTLLAGLAAGSTYSLIGVSREMTAMIALEPLLAVALIVGALHASSLRLQSVLDGSLYDAAGVPWSGLVMAALILFSLQAFVQRAPFDIAEAETELMGGPCMEYSGPKLALLQYAQMVRLIVYLALFTSLFLPWGAGLPFPSGWLLFWVKVLVMMLLVTVIAATHARYRIDQAVRYFAGLLGVSAVALVLASLGY